MDLASRIDAMIVELHDAEVRLERAERMLEQGRAAVTARDLRLGGAHELARAQHDVEEARRLVDEATAKLAVERAALVRPPAH
jgi:hypothetical protein